MPRSQRSGAIALQVWRKNMFRNRYLCAVYALATLLAFTATASATILDATERGTYRDSGVFGSGGSGTSVGNYVTGGLSSGAEFRSFFNFDLTGVTGQITEAVLSISLDRTRAFSPDPTETFGVFDVTSDIPSLLDGSGGISAFEDLGSGASYGVASVLTDSTSGTVSIALNALALLDLNAAIGGDFALGGALTSLSGGTELLFGFSNLGRQQPTRLTLTTTPVFQNQVAIAEPASLTLMGFGLLALSLAYRKSRRS